MIEVTLPWPHRDLSPNARAHYQEKAKKVKRYRADSKLLCTGLVQATAGVPESVHATLTFHPPDKRRRDMDNMLASLKPGLDGVVDAIGVDDSKWTLTLQRGEPVPGGCVHISVEERQSDLVLIPFRGQIR